MQKKQILWAVVFGAMLAITGCGDEGSTAGSGGGGVSGFCSTLCGACGGGAGAQCVSECEAGLGEAGNEIDFDSCPSELETLVQCLGANDCNTEPCNAQFTAYIICIAGIEF